MYRDKTALPTYVFCPFADSWGFDYKFAS